MVYIVYHRAQDDMPWRRAAAAKTRYWADVLAGAFVRERGGQATVAPSITLRGARA